MIDAPGAAPARVGLSLAGQDRPSLAAPVSEVVQRTACYASRDPKPPGT